MYDATTIRTGNMPALRDTDLVFDEEVEPSLTQQQFAAESDINNIIRLNSFSPPDPAQLRYQDVSEISDYHSAIEIVTKAQESFSVLPADVRAQFDNNPALFVDYVTNPDNATKAQEMGLIKPVEPAPIEVEKPLSTPVQTA